MIMSTFVTLTGSSFEAPGGYISRWSLLESLLDASRYKTNANSIPELWSDKGSSIPKSDGFALATLGEYPLSSEEPFQAKSQIF